MQQQVASFSSGGQAPSLPPAGRAASVAKAFGETQALDDVTLEVRPGECHGLVGRNGAGKSTLVSLLTGLSRPDRGAVELGGEPAPGLGDRAAWLRRVACVYQRSMVVPSLTVAENIFLNRPTSEGSLPLVDWRRMRLRARQVMLEWGFDVDVDEAAGSLTVEQRQVVEIARALSIGARFLILDEPTASLEKAAVERLFERVRRLRDGGVGVLYISHHLEEIYEICSRVTVLRDGRLALSRRVDEVTQGELVAAMVGAGAPLRHAGEIVAAERPDQAGETRLEVRDLVVRSRTGSVEGVTFSIKGGECLGLVGLEGSGAATVADCIVGLRRSTAGEMRIAGPVGYVPQDRHARGFAPQLGVGENITLAVLRRLAQGRLGLISRDHRDRLAERQVADLQIVASSLDQPVASLSGGNQQKVVVGRALAVEPRLLVAVNPTVGVDVASKDKLLDALERAREAGVAILLVSDDFEDLRVCNRLLVMVRGRVTRSFEQPPWDRQALIEAVEGLGGD